MSQSFDERMKVTVKKKVALIVFGMLSAVAFVEVGLQLSGFYIQNSRGNVYQGVLDIVASTGDYDQTILAVGDSFTFGGNVSNEHTFPFQLNELANKGPDHSRKYRVINAGKCEANTEIVLENFLDFFKTYRPNIVILLAGAADRYNFTNTRIENEFRKESAEVFNPVVNKGTSWFWSLKTVTLMRVIYTNFLIKGFWEFVSPEPIPQYHEEKIMFSNLEHLFTFYQMLNKGDIHEAQVAFEAIKYPGKTMTFFDLAQSDHYLSDEQLSQEFQNLANSPIYYLTSKQRYKEAMDVIFKFLDVSPLNEYTQNLNFFFHRLLLAFQFQEFYKAEDVALKIKKFLDENRDKIKDQRLRDLYEKYYLYFADQEKLRTQINLKRIENLEKIIEYALSHHAKIIIQNYPGQFLESNEVLENLAKKYSLPFVNQFQMAQDLVIKDGRKKYFDDDEHCTPLTYQFMASNLWEAIQKL